MYEKRIKNLQNILAEKTIDAFLVTNYYNILYLTGFEGLSPEEREAYVVVTKKKTYLITDRRYVDENLETRCLKLDIIVCLISQEKRLVENLKEIIGNNEIEKLGFEAEDLKYLEHEYYKRQLAPVTLIPLQNIAIQLRSIKDDEERTKIQKACTLTDECLREIVKYIEIGKTEKEIAFKIESWIREEGFDLAFDPIVAIDANSALAHYNTKTGHGMIKDESIVLIDFGIKYQKYVSDITRMVFVGKQSDEVMKTYDQLKNVQEEAIDKLAKETYYREIDTFCRVLDFAHSTGHGVGLEVHEYPKVSMYSSDMIQPGQVVTIEPGVYFEGKWGMRVEDTVVISNRNKDIRCKGENLTKFSKDFLVI